MGKRPNGTRQAINYNLMTDTPLYNFHISGIQKKTMVKAPVRKSL